jgi:hypothetical protein
MSGCSSHKRLISGDCPGQAISKSMTAVASEFIPLLSKEGRPRSGPGWLVKGRVASLHARVAILILFELLTTINASPYRARASRPSAPIRNGTFLLRRSRPSLKRRGMDPSRNHPHSLRSKGL